MQFHRHRLANGLQIIAETNPRVHSVAVGFFVKTGSRDETLEVSGVSHFLEHMAFKGDERFSADDVNRILDEVGARYNASTSEELTLFYAAVIPEYLDKTFELLAALMMPSLRSEDFDLEKQVILEEIGMYEDLPGFQAYDMGMAQHFAGHPLGQSILGSKESIQALTVEQMREYHTRRYHAQNITLAVAGQVEFADVVRLAETWCGSWRQGEASRDCTEASPQGGLKLLTREANHQQHLMQLGPAPSAQSSMRFAAEVLAVVVGDDSGSRLFWDLVDPGDAESAELSFHDYDGSGCWSAYLCCLPGQVPENLARMHRIFDEINANGVSEAELERAKNKTLSRIVLAAERPMGRLSSLGGNWVYREVYSTVADDLAAIRAVDAEQIRQLLMTYPLRLVTTVGVGPLESLEAAVSVD
ncbi:MAG: pitrilysin family protein [Planctomycetaceae bacterium]